MAPTGAVAPPQAPPRARSTSSLGRFRGLLVLLAIAVVVVVVGVVFRDRITGNAGSLQVGDCFDLPAGAAASSSVGDVQHHPCTEAHGGEVFAVLTYPATASDTYPPTDAFDAFAADQCSSSFQTYTGISYDATTSLAAGYFFPLDSGWANGDRTVICYLMDAGGQPLTRSMKSAAP
ncbi:MAG TPA: septum formation family protein [Candidatus Sulfotelmatobacter sp.]|nr:septum formation family protein [Candidatus Sulfotelmatobacter sp.]